MPYRIVSGGNPRSIGNSQEMSEMLSLRILGLRIDRRETVILEREREQERERDRDA